MRLGRYKLEKRIAVGGMAELFLGKLEGAAGFEKTVAIKKILPQWSSDPDFISMLVDEAKIVVSLNHPNIVQVIELGHEAESYFIVMEYVSGMDLRSLLREAGPLPVDVSCLIIQELLSGLSYAHSKKIVHRDISPQNLLLSSEGQVKITDFGIAKAASRSRESHTGVLKGKFAYMSPEQASGLEVDTRSDLFSAAVIFYEMLTGERLFEGKGEIDTLDKVRRGQVVFTPHFESKVDPELKKIFQKSLTADRSARFQTASEFREALLFYAQQKGISLRPEALVACLKKRGTGKKENFLKTETVSWRPQRQRKNVPATLILLAGVSGALFFGYQTWRNRSHPEDLLSPSEVKSGYLSVQVVPWGKIVIDGRDSYESPLQQLPLPEGTHHLQVSYDPEKKQYSKEVQLVSGGHTVCFTDVKSGRGIECR
ncbi:MAG: serine/threonine protein kinase [Deltaproteobacteria bacterium]|nr:serine/threonine protein kinase [Deltaproteobacteria bacterium]